MTIQYRPIQRWPGKLSEGRRSAQFKASYDGTLRLLERELRMSGAESPVVQLALHEAQFRRDGRPYSEAEPAHPGVIVSFLKPINTPTGVRRIPLQFPCDTFSTWETNLRAVALALEALRMVDRYGVTQNAEQYTGFKALPPPGPSHEAVLTVDEAARFVAAKAAADLSIFKPEFRNQPIAVAADAVLADPEVYRQLYRAAAALLHPDADGGAGAGQSDAWARLQAAKSLLDQHHGKSR